MITGDLYMDLFLLAIIAAVIGAIGYQIWWHMKYKKVRSEKKFDEGVVTDMDYTPPRTTTTFNGKSTSTSTTPAKHEVYIKFKKIGEKCYNDVELYETVRMDDDVTAEYVEVWKVEKLNPRNKELMRYETISVTSPKGRKVAL